jgi:hypothetical protein
MIVVSSSLLAYIDSDFDGVSDTYDLCPNTPFSDLVDSHGCTIKKVSMIEEIRKLVVIVGLNHATYQAESGNKTRTLSESLEIDYEIEKIRLMLRIARFTSKNSPLSQYDESDFSDTKLAIQYRLDQLLPQLSLSIGGGIEIPTYKGNMHNNGLDWYTNLNANYFVNQVSLFANYTFTKVGDKDLSYVSYQDTHAFNVGVGYSFISNLYSSFSYYISDSIMESQDRITSLSWFALYNLSQKSYVTLSFTHGLNKEASSDSYGVQFGYKL